MGRNPNAMSTAKSPFSANGKPKTVGQLASNTLLGTAPKLQPLQEDDGAYSDPIDAQFAPPVPKRSVRVNTPTSAQSNNEVASDLYLAPTPTKKKKAPPPAATRTKTSAPPLSAAVRIAGGGGKKQPPTMAEKLELMKAATLGKGAMLVPAPAAVKKKKKKKAKPDYAVVDPAKKKPQTKASAPGPTLLPKQPTPKAPRPSAVEIAAATREEVYGEEEGGHTLYSGPGAWDAPVVGNTTNGNEGAEDGVYDMETTLAFKSNSVAAVAF
jgi:hypothetical protein